MSLFEFSEKFNNLSDNELIEIICEDGICCNYKLVKTTYLSAKRSIIKHGKYRCASCAGKRSHIANPRTEESKMKISKKKSTGRTFLLERRKWSEMKRFAKENSIFIDLSWNKFENFFKDMGSIPQNGTFRLSRKDLNKGFFIDNCYWRQCKSTKIDRKIESWDNIHYKNEIKSLVDWVLELNLDYATTRNRLKNGWSVERAFEEKVKSRNRKTVIDINGEQVIIKEIALINKIDEELIKDRIDKLKWDNYRASNVKNIKLPICNFDNTLLPLTPDGIFKMDKDRFIDELTIAHPEYNYSETNICEYFDDEIVVYCPKHGYFHQQLFFHLSCGSCPKCNILPINKENTIIQFMEKAIAIHGKKYDYFRSRYVSMNKKIIIRCPKHGDFNIRPDAHVYQKQGCRSCGYEKRYIPNINRSSQEDEVINFIKSFYNGKIELNVNILQGKQIDIYIPDLRIGIEYHGEYWHCCERVGKYYHKEKADIAVKEKIDLIQIFGFEWSNKKEICKSRIKAFFNCFDYKIGARECIVTDVLNDEKTSFLNNFHIQGNDNSPYQKALRIKATGEIVSIMTFGKPRHPSNKIKFSWEIYRFANRHGVSIHGGASKLLQSFRKEHPGSIISFADRRWSNGKVYKKLGFQLIDSISIDYYYYHFKTKQLFNRGMFSKKNMKTKIPVYSDDLCEYQNMLKNGYDRVYGAGNLKFVLD